jgi:hypothetical protein
LEQPSVRQVQSPQHSRALNGKVATTIRLRARSERWTFMPIEGLGIIRRASTRDLEEVLRVINRSNAEAYKDIIPEEHFREPVHG